MPPAGSGVLEVRLRVTYPRPFDFACRVEGGKVHLGVGPNGSGKTTFLKAIAGLVPAEGTVRWRGQDLLKLPPRVRARKVGYLPQVEEGTPGYRVEEMVLMGRFPYWRTIPSPEDREQVRRVLKVLDLERYAHRSITALSGGERQWVRFARMVAQDPWIVLLDEPEQHLDPERRELLIMWVRRWKEEGRVVFWVSHTPCGLEEVADVVWSFVPGVSPLPVCSSPEGRAR